MIRRVVSSTRLAKSAPVPMGWRRREPQIHGRQDKSAGRGRAYVVGAIEVSGNLSHRPAGASSTKTSDFNGPGAVAPFNAGRRSP